MSVPATSHQGVDYRRPLRDRADNDWYVEPRWAVDLLLDAERFAGNVWDPACGSGNIPAACRSRGLRAFGSDKVYRGWGLRAADFLEEGRAPDVDPPYDNIITNPPYAHAEAFIHRGLEIARFKVAMLLRLSFLESRRRAEMFATTPLARVHVFAERVSMPPGHLLEAGEVEAKGGTIAFAWFVWSHDHQGPPTLSWLRRPRP